MSCTTEDADKSMQFDEINPEVGFPQDSSDFGTASAEYYNYMNPTTTFSNRESSQFGQQNTTTSDEMDDLNLEQYIEKVYKGKTNLEKYAESLEEAIIQYNKSEAIGDLITENIEQYSERAKQEILNEIALNNRRYQYRDYPRDHKFSMKITEKIQDLEKGLKDKIPQIGLILKKYIQLKPSFTVPNDFNLNDLHVKLFQDIIYSDKTIQEFCEFSEKVFQHSYADNDDKFSMMEFSNQFQTNQNNKRKRKRKPKQKTSQLLDDEIPAPIEYAKDSSKQSDQKSKKKKKNKIELNQEQIDQFHEQCQLQKSDSKCSQGNDGNEEFRDFEKRINNALVLDDSQKLIPFVTEDWIKKLQSKKKSK